MKSIVDGHQIDFFALGERIVYRHSVIILALIAGSLAGMHPPGSQAAPPAQASREDVVVLRHCDLDYEKSTLIGGHSGTGMAIPFQDCLVRLGDKVKTGQVLGRVFDRDLRITLGRRKAEAASDIDVRLAESKRDELLHKLRRIEKLRGNAQPYASEEEYETARVLYEAAQLMIEDAKYKRTMAHIESEEIQAQINIREMVAPHDGTIVEVFKKPGETVLAGQPVFQVVQAERLRVTAHANLSDYNRIRPGQKIEIALETDALDPELLKRTFEGKILFVDQRIDARSQTCRVVAEVDNHDLAVAAGLEARMTIFVARPPVVTPPAAAGRLSKPLADRAQLLPERAARTP
jgi:HlyD family secretion protein